MKNKVLPIEIIGSIFIIFLGVVFFLNQKTANLELHLAPTDATISINGETYPNHATIKLAPGNYTLEISAEDFDSKQISITLERNQNLKLTEYLTGKNHDFSYYETSVDDLYLLREYLYYHQDDTGLLDFLTSYDQKLSIRSILPLHYLDPTSGENYYVFYQENHPSCKKIYCLEIGASSKTYFSSATKAIKDHGYNPDDYQILYSTDTALPLD